VKDLKEEIDVDRVRKQGNDREEVKKLRIQMEKHREGTSTRLSDAYDLREPEASSRDVEGLEGGV
jgi:hypothetical protein